MLAPLSNRPFHTIRWRCESLADAVSSLFFAAISCFNPKWEKYSEYYNFRCASRDWALKNYHDHIIQVSFNTLHPRKEPALPAFEKKEHYEIIEFPVSKNYLKGLCAGMSVDHLNRVRNSKKPFWETIKELSEKYVKGCTKKGFINQQTYSRITPSEKFVSSFKKSLRKRAISAAKSDPKYNLNKEDPIKIEEKVDNLVKQNSYLFLLGYRLEFIAKNYILSFTSQLNDEKTIQIGDYILLEHGSMEKPMHAVCIYKREEGLVLFDSNLGTLFFDSDAKLLAFIKKQSVLLFGNDQLFLNLYKAGP